MDAAFAGGDRLLCIAASRMCYALFGMMNWVYYWYRPHGSLRPEAIVVGLADQAMAKPLGPTS